MHMSKKGPEPASWPDYLRAAMKAKGYANAADLARQSGLNETQISRWMRGQGQPSLANLRRLVPALGRPMLELTVAAGHLDPDEAQMKTRPEPPSVTEPLSVVTAISEDRELIPEAREHLLNQYGLLLRLRSAGVVRPIRTAAQDDADAETSLDELSQGADILPPASPRPLRPHDRT